MFQAPKLTNGGKALYYANIGGQGITFTQMKVGKGTLTGPIAPLTDLVDTVVAFDAALSHATGTYADISGSFSNAGMTEGFYWKEIGVFAADPDYPDDRTKDILFCYQNAYDTADYIPAAAVETIEKEVTIPIIVGDATTVSCLLDHSLIFATIKDIEDHNEATDAHADIRDDITDHADNTVVHVTTANKNAWNNKVDKATGSLAFSLGRDADGIYVEYTT